MGKTDSQWMKDGSCNVLHYYGLPESSLGAIQKEVRKYLIEHPLEDTTFIIGSVCTLESAPSYSEEEVEECSMCWPADMTSEDGIAKTKECIATYLPNIGEACQSEIDAVDIDTAEEGAGNMVMECFMKFVKENDPEGGIQDGVRKYLDDNPSSYPEFILGSSCTIESGPDYNDDKIEQCSKCWPG